MPGIDRLAGVMQAHDPGTPMSDHLSLLIFAVARWRVGSSRELESLVAEPSVWAMVGLAASRVGRDLSSKPPTYDMFHAFRARLDQIGRPAWHAFVAEFQQAFTEVAVAEARSLGLLQECEPDWHNVQRGNAVAADGTIFKAASGVSYDAEGKLTGSRADGDNPNGRGPRLVAQDSLKNIPGAPVAAATVRGDGWNQRIVLGVEAIVGGKESQASRDLIDHILGVAGTQSVHVVVYDRLYAGADMDRLLQAGVLPVVAMKNAEDKAEGRLAITDEQVKRRYPPGREPSKKLLKLRQVSETVHGPDGCVHAVWGLDGSVVILPVNVPVTVDSQPSHAVDFVRTPGPDGSVQWHGVYEYTCAGELHTTEVHLTKKVETLSKTTYAANTVLPIPETDPRFPRIYAWRQDIEATFATLKRPLHLDDRALSYDLAHFLFDMLAAGLLLNAIAWDVHAPTEMREVA